MEDSKIFKDKKRFDLFDFFKNNLDNFVLFLICSIYIFRGIANIEESGKTALEIVADGFVAFTAGYLIKTLLGKKGLLKGLIADKFISTTSAYGNKMEDISGFVEELTPFCDKKNDDRLRQKQIKFLTKHAMSYKMFKNGIYDSNPKYEKILKECRNIKVFQYTPVVLTNAYDNTADEEELLTATIKKYEKKQRFGDFAIGFIMFMLFGYFSLGKGEWNWAMIQWYSLQIAIFLTMGMIKYMGAYFFVTETLRGKIKRVMAILDEFINIRKKNPRIFEVKYEEELKEVKQEKEDDSEKEPKPVFNPQFNN